MIRKATRFAVTGGSLVILLIGGAIILRWRSATPLKVVDARVLSPIAAPGERGIPLNDDPSAPADVLTPRKTPLPELVAWAHEWDAAHLFIFTDERGYTAESKLKRLAVLIEQSDLSDSECLQIGEIVKGRNDMPAANLWATIGRTRARPSLR